MSILDGEYPLSRDMDNWGEPSSDDLAAIEVDEDLYPRVADVDESHLYPNTGYEEVDE